MPAGRFAKAAPPSGYSVSGNIVDAARLSGALGAPSRRRARAGAAVSGYPTAMKKAALKLRIHFETTRVLGAMDLAHVAGGDTGDVNRTCVAQAIADTKTVRRG